MAGYDGYSKSNNALLAESEGKLPLSRAITEVARIAGCTRKAARESLLAIGPSEWHHTSKHYNRTDYYDVAAAVRRVHAQPLLAALPSDWKARMTAIRTEHSGHPDRINAADSQLAVEYGVPVETLVSAYYEAWDE